MFYEEKIISGELMYRTTPNGVWYSVSNKALTKRILELESLVNSLKGYK